MNLGCFGYLFTCHKVRIANFGEVDHDHYGRISMSEFQSHFLKEFGRHPSNEDWASFHKADKNNDGFVSKYDIALFEKDTHVLSRS